MPSVRCYFEGVREATVLAVVLLGACTDLRDFRGDWRGPRIGDAEAVRVGVTDTATAQLAIDEVATRGMHGTLEVDQLVAPGTPFRSLDGAEADTLATLSIDGALRVYLGFVPIIDGAGEAFAIVALYADRDDDRRVDLRLMRSGPTPLYGIFELSEAP